MNRESYGQTGPLLLQVLRRRAYLTDLTLADWDLLIRQANSMGLLGRVAAIAAGSGCLEAIAQPVRAHLIAASKSAESAHRSMRWEVDRICRALQCVDTPILLLKGSAYVMCGLENAQGRISSDVDILVPRENLPQIEAALLEHGWAHVKRHPYDQKFFREWSHELPPLQHRDRGTVVDVHHNIVPLTARLHPDPSKLLDSAVTLDASSGKLRVLAPVDMVLHCAVHLFHSNEWSGRLRDLVDVDLLLQSFGTLPSFWDQLIPRAVELDLRRPLAYGLRYAVGFLQTSVPLEIISASNKWLPNAGLLRMMDWLAGKSFLNISMGKKRLDDSVAELASYVRSHWLSMPPYLLIPHLSRKALRRWQVNDDS